MFLLYHISTYKSRCFSAEYSLFTGIKLVYIAIFRHIEKAGVQACSLYRPNRHSQYEIRLNRKIIRISFFMLLLLPQKRGQARRPSSLVLIQQSCQTGFPLRNSPRGIRRTLRFLLRHLQNASCRSRRLRYSSG